MAQYIDKDILVAEIERLYDEKGAFYAADVLYNLEEWIDALEVKYVDLQEEQQVKESAEIQHVNDMCKENGNSLTQKPVNEVWHNMSEEAENGRNIIIIDPKNFYGAVLRKGGSQLRNHNKERYVKWAYIDDLQNFSNIERTVKNWKEPVSEDLEEAADNALSNVLNTHEIVNVRSCLEMFRLGAKWQKTKDESTTEDLGEYINELSKQFPDVSFAKLSRIAVRVAKWQEDKDKQILNEEGVIVLPEEEFERMKRSLIKLAEREQQIMAKAIDGVVTFDYYGDDDKTYGCVAHDSFCLEDFGLKDRDKVKVIVIKED